jgi:hypothetical protein
METHRDQCRGARAPVAGPGTSESKAEGGRMKASAQHPVPSAQERQGRGIESDENGVTKMA